MTINEPITVGLINNAPKYVIWKGRNYTVLKIGFHHIFRKGSTLYHVFSVMAESLFMRVKLNTDNLKWRLEEISDNE